MVTFKKMRIYIILVLVFGVAFSSCTTDQYDLSKGLNTDMKIGGDSLTIPIGKTDSIFLGKLIGSQTASILKKNADGSYSLSMKDSMQVKMGAINPITFEVNPVTEQSDMPIPNIDIPDNQKQVGFSSTFDMGANLSSASQTRRLSKTNLSTTSQTTSGATILITGNSTFTQSLNFTFPKDPGKTSPLKKINYITLKNSEVTMTFVKTTTPSALTITSNTLDSFEIYFPAEFELVPISNNGTVEKKMVDGKLKSVYSIINQAVPIDNTPFTAKFKIVSLDVSQIDQSGGSLVYSEDIPYRIRYSCNGDIEPLLLQPTDELKVHISINASSVVDDMNIVTNIFDVPVASGKVPISQTIVIPKEVDSISSVSFNNGAELRLSFIDPGISPFTFSESDCFIYLPKTLILKPHNGLDLSTNTLTISSKQLFNPINIGIEGIKTDKTHFDFSDQKLTVADSLVYDISGLKVDSTPSMLSKLPSNRDLQIKVNGSSSVLSVSTIVGKINPVIDPIFQNIKIDLPTALKNSSNNLDIKNPVIELEFGNTMGFPIDLTMDLIPKSKGVAIPDATITTSLHIQEASVLGQTTPSKYRISATGKDSVGNFYPEGIPFPDGYISKPIANLPNLLKTIPDSIEIIVKPKLDLTKKITIDLNPTIINKLDVKYAINVPLDFGGDFKIQYNDTISDLKSKLKDVFKLTHDVGIIAIVENQIPMDLAFSITARDSVNGPIQGITISTPDSIIKSGNISLIGIPITTTSTISFELKETVANSLNKLDKLFLTIYAKKDPTIQSIPLKSSQYLIVGLKVKLPEGITINQKK